MEDPKKTQPIPAPTASDVLEVFGHFRQDLLGRIDERDKNVLALIQNIINDLLAENRRIIQRGDDHEKRIAANSRDIEELRKKQSELASEVQAVKLALKRVETKP